MPGGELPLKNKTNIDEQNISLFDGHEDLINDIQEAEPETIENTSENVVEIESEESSTPFVIEEAEEHVEPHFDESEATDNSQESSSADEGENIAENTEEESADTDQDESSASEDAKAEDEVKKPAPATEEKPRRVDSLFDFIELFIFTLAAIFLITSFFFKYSNVVGDSMQNTLQSGEKLVLTNFLYTPKPGDVVVIDDRSLKDPIVKRIIAVGGQRVKITSTDIYVDGERLIEDYVYIDANGGKYLYSVTPCEALKDNLIDYKEGEYYEILIPENEVFVMGDHRNKSYDSRDIGTLHEDAILGKAVIRFFPFDKFGKLD